MEASGTSGARYRLACTLVWSMLTWLQALGGAGGQDVNCTGVTSSEGVCYSVLRDAVTWSEAQNACRDAGGFLAAITDPEQQILLGGLLQAAGVERVWIGGFHTRGSWRWLDSDSSNGSPLLPQGCYSDQDTKRDLPIEISTLDTTRINPEMCIQACQGQGYQYAANQGGVKCFCGNSFGQFGTNRECVIECPGHTQSQISRWCGGTLMNSVYRVGGDYGNWAYHQPNNHNGNQNCGILDNSVESKMADEDCLDSNAYLCQIDPDRCPTSGSDPDYVRLGGQCYYFNEELVTWYEARSDCQMRGGQLATIRSSSEFERFRNLTRLIQPKAIKVWIGLYKTGGWSWASGAPFRSIGWAPGHPVLPDTCAMMDANSNYDWAETDCDTSLAYVCESDPNSAPRTTNFPSLTTQLGDSQNVTSSGSTSPSGVTRGPVTSSLDRSETADFSMVTDDGLSVSVSDLTTAATTTQALGNGNLGQSVNNQDLSTTEIALIAAFSVLGLLLLILLIVCVVCYRKHKRRKKIYCYDARPEASVPNGGSEVDYEIYTTNSRENLHRK